MLRNNCAHFVLQWAGGQDAGGDVYSTVLEFSPNQEEWGEVGSKGEGRHSHALSIITLQEVQQYCS